MPPLNRETYTKLRNLLQPVFPVLSILWNFQCQFCWVQKFESLTPPRPFLLLPISTPFEHDTRTGLLDCNHKLKFRNKILSVASQCSEISALTPQERNQPSTKTEQHENTNARFSYKPEIQNKTLSIPSQFPELSSLKPPQRYIIPPQELNNLKHTNANFLRTHRPNMSFKFIKSSLSFNNPSETSHTKC